MSKTFLRAVLAAFAAAGIAGAQTPPPLSPTSTPPMPAAAPVRQVAFKVMPQPVPPAAQPAPTLPQFLTKVFDVADLVAPAADSPLAKPSEDKAMTAAVNAYTAVRAEHLMRVVRTQVDKESWDGRGGSGRLDFHPNGCSLVVNNTAGTVARVGECLESLRRLKSPQVFVEMLVGEVASDHPAMAKLFGKKREAALTKEELTKLVRELKADGALDVLSRPQLMLTDKQTGFFQTGQQFPRLTGMTLDGKGVQQGVEYIPTGLVVRLTPDCAGDGKTMRMRTEVTLTEPSPSLIDLGNGIKAQPIDCQAIEAVLELADGGTMAVNIGTKKREQRIEHKVPVLGDLPFIGRLFRNVGITHERRDTVVVFTATRVKSEDHLRSLAAAAQAKVSWSIAAPQAVMPAMAVAPPMAKPVSDRVGKIVIVGNSSTQDRVILKQLDSLKPGQVLEYPRIEEARQNLIRLQIFDEKTPPTVEVLPGEPGSPFRDIRVTVKETKTGMISLHTGVNSNKGLNGSVIVQMRPPVTPIPMPIHNPFALVPPVAPPQVIREVAVVGLERIDLDMHLIPASGSVPVTGRIAGAGHGGIPAGDETTALMKSYRAACAAGKKDEASRLALQLLAKDPTCFGRDR